MAVASQVSSSLCEICDQNLLPHLVSRVNIRHWFSSIDSACNSRSVTVRCEQSSKGSSGVDLELVSKSRLAKDCLRYVGLPTPLPTVALAVTALAGVLTAVFIYQSASQN